MILLDEPSMGLAPQLVEEIFEIVGNLNEEQGVSFLLAEQNTNVALRYAKYGYILESGRIVLDGDATALRRERGRQGILSRHRRRRPQILPRRQALQAAQALAFLKPVRRLRKDCVEAIASGSRYRTRDRTRTRPLSARLSRNEIPRACAPAAHEHTACEAAMRQTPPLPSPRLFAISAR